MPARIAQAGLKSSSGDKIRLSNCPLNGEFAKMPVFRVRLDRGGKAFAHFCAGYLLNPLFSRVL
jgi:hypothetical protein